jgi:hemerythrin-like domain-containing protein
VKAIEKIRDEHRSISAILHGLKQLARDAQDAHVRPEFAVFRAMLRYIDEFPEKLHHPKEDNYLFPPLAGRAPGAQALIDGLRREHEDGKRLIRELERSLVLFEDSWPAGAGEFLRTVEGYADFHWKHMRKEEHELLPLAEKYLPAETWESIDRAFDANRDPIAGVLEKDFRSLFTRIVNLAPAPIGLGDRWQRTG